MGRTWLRMTRSASETNSASSYVSPALRLVACAAPSSRQRSTTGVPPGDSSVCGVAGSVASTSRSTLGSQRPFVRVQ